LRGETNPPPGSDAHVAHWLSDAQDGCADAQGQLVEHCRAYLMAIASSELDPALRAKVAVSDVVQETLIRAQQGLEGFDGSSESELFAWLRRILLNHVSDVRRRYRGSDKRDLKRESGFEAALSAMDSATPGRTAIAREQVEKLRAALAGLPADYRQVITLRNWDQLPFGEIGQRMNRSPEAVRMLWTRAVRQLGEAISDDDGTRCDASPEE